MIKTALIVCAALVATPALAADFTGPRIEATVGADSVQDGIDPTEITYGAAVGYDLGVTERITLGVEADVGNVFDRRNVGVSARAGYKLNDNVLAYVKAGYANWRQLKGHTLEGLRVGGGVDVALVGPFYTGLSYEYSNFEDGMGQHGVKAKIGIRF